MHTESLCMPLFSKLSSNLTEGIGIFKSAAEAAEIILVAIGPILNPSMLRSGR